ncbi:tetratricopeptide repeat protein [Thiobacter aerophilum]|uniref:Tetratricopeptide repeat protein n=1 Tax=Thiobacter aerophilum TaxID=3121275 RepID=A0ABV0EDD0_9BURK
MKALKSVERAPSAPDWALEPMMGDEAPPRSAQAAADLIRAHGEESGNRRLVALLVLLIAVVVGLAAYFYVAVYMPWLFLPKPPAPSAPPAAPPTPSPASPAPQPNAPAPERVPPLEVMVKPTPRASPAVSQEQAAPLQPPSAVGQPLIRPSTQGNVAEPSSDLAQAYALLEAGREAEAEAAYLKLQARHPDNPDVLLALAVIAQNRNENEQAARLYSRVLEKDPRNGYAQAALVALIGRGEPARAEARLRALIAERPAAYLHYALGNLLAAQGRWHEAQQAYFEAQRLEPEVADYAFNLAVSLEHLGEARLAAEYYRRALRLAQQQGSAHFDPATTQAHLRQLSP